MGTPEFAIPSLKAVVDYGCTIQAVCTQPDRPVGRKKVMTPSPIKCDAESLGLPIITPEKVNTPEILERLRQFNPELIIVCAYGKILPQKLLDIPTIGCFNLHFSFLPRWRGASPVQAAICAGDTHTGVTLQKLVLKLDAGPVVAKSSPVEILPTDTYQTLGERLSHISGNLIKENLPSLFNKTFKLEDQDENQVTFCRIIKKHQGHINWKEETADEIERKLRAYTPWPGIYSMDDHDKRLQFTEVKVLMEHDIQPGVVQNDFIIGAKKGAVQVVKLKPEGKSEMTSEDFLRGHSDLIGSSLN